ncbi:hypothetical protein [Thermococcus thioreducens]|uniref:Uncharacterized protein n=1 Tax=Thermococcus thioreducens TaxID=277988 RepID=A0A0Q2S4G4_9EURY|nr:hypothetical protein [Thermococcus thioreducens]ASJ12883.1 hypothetical protein A3L14_08285 [Thermococcus thioreducens]KQH82347.1 hypothetical protein AMR53_07045 [Thermococcus thioreducens]SEV83880.1 hypothetical protein SAMN05216170_0288 [Thermococcus thioreducens]
MQANVNLDVLLEKMMAELEKAKKFRALKPDNVIENCIDSARKAAEERDSGNVLAGKTKR